MDSINPHGGTDDAALVQSVLGNELVALTRLHDRRFVWVNAVTVRMFGYEAGELIGRTTRVLFPSAEAYEHLGAEAYAALDTVGTHRSQTEMVRKDGSRIWVDVYGVRLPGSGDVLVSFADLTPIRNAQARLLEAHRMESVGRLVGGVAHEFNNRLQTILGGAELALMGVPATSQVAADLRQIQDAARHAAGITQQLMAYARRQMSTPRSLDMNDAITASLVLVRPSLPAAATVSVSLAPDLWPVRVDPMQFTDVIANLVMNAREAIREDGVISIETAKAHISRAEAERTPDAHAGDFAMLVVRDDGAGMDRETLSHVFEPFFTTKRVGQNSGLGLSTVYGIVTQHGGWVQIDSEPGRGTSVSVYLPRDAGAAEVASAARNSEVEPRTALLVEDDPAVRRISSTMLQRIGFRVLSTASAEEALRLVKSRPTRIDALVSDVVLPGMDGGELADQLRADHPEARVVLVSAHTLDTLGHRRARIERYPLLPKPYTVEQLREHLVV